MAEVVSKDPLAQLAERQTWITENAEKAVQLGCAEAISLRDRLR